MHPKSPSFIQQEQDDDLFADKLEEIATLILEGKEIPWAQIQTEHPSWVAKIEELLPTIQALSRKEQAKLVDPTPQSSLDFTVHESLKLVRIIGRGGMGVVWEAIECPLQRSVAVKLIDPDLAESEHARLRFENEAKIAANLHHPNIVPIYSIGQMNGNLYYTMPFIHGVTLSMLREQWLFRSAEATTGTMPVSSRVRSILRIGVDAAEALHAAHESGVVHRDIKPSNIMVEANNHPWILDFGLACLDGQKTMTDSGKIVGTLRYMAPERLHGAANLRFDPRLDVYSLGATLYELLALQPPYANHGQEVLLQLITNAAPTPLRQIDPSLPADVVHVIEKAMERDAKHRYATCLEFAEDLQRCLDGHRIRARRVTAWTRTQRYIQSNPIRFSACILLISVLTVFGTLTKSWLNELENAKDRLRSQVLSSERELDSKNRFLAINEVKEQRSNRHPGWRAKSLAKLESIASTARDEAETRLLRDEYAACLMGKDLEYDETLMTDVDIFCGKWSPVDNTLAIGMNLEESGHDVVYLLSGKPLRISQSIALSSPREAGCGNETIVGVRCLAFDSKGDRLAVGMRTGMVHLIDLKSNKELLSRRLGTSPCLSLAFSPDDDWIAVGGEGKELAVLDCNTFEVLDTVDVEKDVKGIHWSKDELVCMSQDLFVFRMRNKRLDLVDRVPIKELSFYVGAGFHDGMAWIASAQGNLMMLNRFTGEKHRDFRPSNRNSFDVFSNSSRFCLDSTSRFLISTDRGGVRLWDYGNGEHLLRVPIQGNSAIGADFSPNGRELASWGNRELKRWNLSQSTIFGATEGTMYPVLNMGFIENSNGVNMLWTFQPFNRYNLENRGGFFRATSTDGFRLEFIGPLAEFQVLSSAKERLVAACSEPCLYAWTAITAKREEFPGSQTKELKALLAMKDGSDAIAAYDMPIENKQVGVRSRPILRRIDLSSGAISWETSCRAGWSEDIPMHFIDVVLDDQYAWCLLANSTVCKVRLSDGGIDWIERFEIDNAEKIDVEPREERLAVGTTDGRIAMIDHKTKQVIANQEVHFGTVSGVKFLFDGIIATTGIDGNVILLEYDAEHLQPRLRMNFEGASIVGVEYSPSLKMLSLHCKNEHLVRWIQVDKLLDEFRRLNIGW